MINDPTFQKNKLITIITIYLVGYLCMNILTLVNTFNISILSIWLYNLVSSIVTIPLIYGCCYICKNNLKRTKTILIALSSILAVIGLIFIITFENKSNIIYLLTVLSFIVNIISVISFCSEKQLESNKNKAIII